MISISSYQLISISIYQLISISGYQLQYTGIDIQLPAAVYGCFYRSTDSIHSLDRIYWCSDCDYIEPASHPGLPSRR